MDEVLDPSTAQAIDRLAAGIDALQGAGVTPQDAADARALIVGLETQARRLRSLQVDLVAEIDRTAVHAEDGHASAKVMVRHVGNLSNAEACRRTSSARALGRLAVVADAFRAGRIGGCQVERIARAHANSRVRGAVEANEASFATEGQANSYLVFDRMVAAWVDLVDEDGARDRNQRNHENRDFRPRQGFDGSWELAGSCGSFDGVRLDDVFRAFLEAETLADWDRARAEHGEAATVADLARTEGQRRFDALMAIFECAAGAKAAAGGSSVVTDVVIDHHTLERVAARLAGVDPAPLEDALKPFPVRGHRCSTLDGRPVEATEAVAHALLGDIRRVVVGSDGVVIDLGRRRRLFTGPAALAVRLSATTCYWPGCQVAVTDCQSDHLTGWDTRADGSGGGSTSPGNGAPACGRHNRIKEHGYTVHRDDAGTLHVLRPDGTHLD